MNYPEYKSDLAHIYQSEVYGSNVFWVAKKLTRNTRRVAKWEMLYQLEVQTLNRFIEHIKATQQDCTYPLFWSIKGYIEGFLLSLLPWKMGMKILAKETQSFTKIWKRLKTNAQPEEQDFFNYIYAHEKAIESFAKLEMNNDQRSILGVSSLLKEDR
jgi:hypothetical protein